jgi:hypothetical protein
MWRENISKKDKLEFISLPKEKGHHSEKGPRGVGRVERGCVCVCVVDLQHTHDWSETTLQNYSN